MPSTFVAAMLRPINTAATILLGVYTITWGAWLLGPWDAFSTARLYSRMASIAPEWYWGGEAVICGMLMSYGALRRSYGSLSRGAVVTALHWSTVSLLLFLGDWHNPGGITDLFISMYSGFIYLNLSANHHSSRGEEDGSP